MTQFLISFSQNLCLRSSSGLVPIVYKTVAVTAKLLIQSSPTHLFYYLFNILFSNPNIETGLAEWVLKVED